MEQSITQPVESQKKGRDGFALAGKIFVAVIVLTGYVLLVNRCHTEQAHLTKLQADSTKKVSIIQKIQKQADDALAFAETYKIQIDSIIKAGDMKVDTLTSKLTYSEKIRRYLQGLIDNKTLSPTTGNVTPADERVVVAGLKTLQREQILKSQNDGLTESIAVREAKILALRQDKQTLKEGVLKIKQKALPRTKQGFWFIKAAARRQAKETVKQADETLESSNVSELEIKLNQ